MKKLILLSALIVGLCACDSKDLYVENDIVPADFSMLETYKVEVPEGKTKSVYVDGALVYEGDVSLTISVPKSIVGTRSINETEIETLGNPWGRIYKEGMLLFEDVTDGDNDYNDFICYIQETLEVHNKNGNVKYRKMVMTPKAMGNTLPLEFGVELIVNGEMWKDIVLSEDVRKDFYENATGFINTAEGETIDGQEITVENENAANGTANRLTVATNHYIKVNGVKRYACDSDKAVLTQNNVPFGLFVPSTWIKENYYIGYAKERKSMFEAYPGFMKWVNGESVNPFANPAKDLLY